MTMSKNRVWRESWPAISPGDIDPPYFVDGEVLVSLRDGKVLHTPRYPERRAESVAKAALRQGALLVDRWDVKWGLAVGLAFPGSNCAVFVLEDIREGRFAALGVQRIHGVYFGHPLAFYWGDEDAAVRFGLCYGIKKKYHDAIARKLGLNTEFPYKNRRLKKLLGPLDVLENETVIAGLKYIQRVKGVNPMTVMTATQTLEIIDE